MTYPSDPKDPVHPGIGTFPELDIARLAAELRLEERGRKNASGDGVTAATHAVIEHEIASTLEALVRKERAQYESQLQTTDNRLAAAGFDAAARVKIEAHVASGLADFRAKVTKQRIRLDVAAENLDEVERQYSHFVASHDLKNVSPIIYTTAEFTWTVVVVMGLLLAESALNAFFFAEGSTAGLLGGLLEAAMLSFVNITIAVILGAFALRYAQHNHLPVRVLGWLLSIVFLAAILAANLLIAHYREAFALAQGGTVDFAAVLSRLAEAPLALKDTKSWLLGLLGIILCAAATWKIYVIGDPYPGFGSIAKRRLQTLSELEHKRGECVDDLQKTHAETIRAMEAEIANVSNKQREYELAARSRARGRGKFIEFLNQAQRCHRSLLDIYYAAAAVARQHPELQLPPPDELNEPPRVDTDAIRGAVEKTSESIQVIQIEYQEAMKAVEFAKQTGVSDASPTTGT